LNAAAPGNRATHEVAFCFLLNHLLAREEWARRKLAPFAGESVELRAAPLPALRFTILPGGRVEAGGEASDLAEICASCDVVIATTGRPGLITPEMIRPGQLIFALSNPRPEIDATAAIRAGARIAENGSQVNNLLCYPGACRGLLDAGARRAPPEAFLAATHAIVAVTPPGILLPNPLERPLHHAVARSVARACVELGVASRDLPPDYFAEE